MVTREQVDNILNDDDRDPFQFGNKDSDYDFMAISLLREKIPSSVRKSIIQGASHDILYLCDVEDILLYLNMDDLVFLADCNVCYEEDNDCLILFV